ERIDELIFLMDSVNHLVSSKSSFVLKILNHVTEVGIKIEDLITDIDNTIIEKKERLFERDQPSMLAFDYGDIYRWNINETLRLFYRIELKELDRYMKQHIPNFISQMVLLAFLVIVFFIVKRRIQTDETEYTSLYKKMLSRIFSRPISAALLLGLFASVLIFENRPPIFIDISVVIATIPLIIIVISVGEKKNNKYAWLFGLLIFLRQVYLIFPPENIVYRFSLLSIAFIESFVILNLLRTFFRYPIKKKILNSIILILLFVHFGFALTGFIGIVAGSTMLAEITLNVAIVNVFAGFLLIVSALIINGLIELAIDSQSFQRVNVFRLHGQYLKKKITDLINFGAVVYWLILLLRVINIDRPIIDGISSFILKEWSIGSASFSLGSILIFIFVIWLSMAIAKIIRIILEEDVLKKLNLAKGVPRTISVMVRFSLVTLGVLLAVSAAGMPLTSLTILFGAFGVGIGFGLQNIFNNLVSGLILLFERPIQIGDTIEVGTLIGNVKSMGIRSSHVRTFDGAEVIVPNGNLISNEVVNWTLSDQKRRIEVMAGVAYGSDPYLVQKLFLKELKDHQDILKDPEPSVLFNDLGESSLDFRLLFWTSNFGDWIRIRSDIVFKVHDILKENNIEIPFPQTDLHIRSIEQSIEIINKANKTK
ncbi:MAG: mechanosensitive ion channel, partial [Bacteroidales bacterium]|nr:mechanosensitive ion channel [Bacteroidales bacterium]